MANANIYEIGGLYPRTSDGKPNAALEWQARRLRWRSKEMMEACPSKGLFGELLNRIKQHQTICRFYPCLQDNWYEASFSSG
jgi:hypothetical protein